MVTRRNRNRQTFSLKTRAGQGLALMGAIFVGAIIFSFFFDEMGLAKYINMWKQAKQLEQEIYDLERSNAALRKEIFRLKHDSSRVEELARDQLGLVRRGETVYQAVQPRPQPLQGK